MNAHTADLLDLEPAPSTKAEETSSKVTAAEIVAALADNKPADEFDWTSDDSIVCQEQPATAVYRNRAGSIVIRQERSWDADEDSFVYISDRTVALAVIAAIKRYIGGGDG